MSQYLTRMAAHMEGSPSPAPAPASAPSSRPCSYCSCTSSLEDEEDSMMDSLMLLAAQHCIEFESESEGSEGEERVITASLLINLCSPMVVRVALGGSLSPLTPPSLSPSLHSPLSPLTLLSQRLHRRVVSRAQGARREAATQTSSPCLSLPCSPSPPSLPSPCRLVTSPSIASGDLPSLSPCRAVLRLPPSPPSTASPERPSSLGTSSSCPESCGRDSLQDIIFNPEETARVREEEERRGEEQPCPQCVEKQKQKYRVRFKMEEIEKQKQNKTRNPKKRSACTKLFNFLHKLIRKYRKQIKC